MAEKPIQYREILFPDRDPFPSYTCQGIHDLSLVNIFIGANNSGKSRLLRSLFALEEFPYKTNKYDYDDIHNLCKNIQQEINAILAGEPRIGLADKNYFVNFIEEKPESQAPRRWYNEAKQVLNNLAQTYPDKPLADGPQRAEQLRAVGKLGLEQLAQCFDTNFDDVKRKYYIPVLRGMRPLKGHSSPYEERTRDDYFKDFQIPNDRKQLFTGLELYRKLRAMRLGKPEKSAALNALQDYLSKKFFGSQPVSLISYEEEGQSQNDETVHIKIGQEPQLPIYHLGDGLQNLIICAFNIFMEHEHCLFFIEEPDMCMHPSLQRAFLEMLREHPQHQYFLTSHSNHLLDMAMDTSDVSIFHFSKTEHDPVQFEIRVTAPGDQAMLRDLGVRNSSVFLANATIWVEGITDRLYLREYMAKYVAELKETDPNRAQKFSQFKEDAHYAFVEYQGANLVHWSFDAGDTDPKCIRAPFICAAPFLIADGDIVGKGQREQTYRDMLGDNFYILPYKEIENLMPVELLRAIVTEDFRKLEKDVANIDSVGYVKPGQGLGQYLDDVLEIPEEKSIFAAASGTLKSHKKIALCNKAVAMAKMQEPEFEWGLTDKLRELCEKIFAHIEQCNQ